MYKTLDTIHAFENRNSKCRLRVYESPGVLSVVVVTELAENPGTTIVNAAAYLAAMIYQKITHPQENLTWIEHHRAGEAALQGEESFDYVTFGNTPPFFGRPHRRTITRTDVEAMIGQALA